MGTANGGALEGREEGSPMQAGGLGQERKSITVVPWVAEKIMSSHATHPGHFQLLSEVLGGRSYISRGVRVRETGLIIRKWLARPGEILDIIIIR